MLENKIKYLDEKQTAHLTGFSVHTLRNHRHLSKGLPYIKAGKSIRYSFSDVINFMDDRRIAPEE